VSDLVSLVGSVEDMLLLLFFFVLIQTDEKCVVLIYRD